MSHYGSNPRLASYAQRSNSRQDLTSYRNDGFMPGNGFQRDHPQMEGGYSYQTTFSRSSMHGGGGMKLQQSAVGVAPVPSAQAIQEKAFFLKNQCQDYLERASMIINSGGPAIEADKFLNLAAEALNTLKFCGRDLQEMHIQNDVFSTVDKLQQWHASVQQKLYGTGTIGTGTIGTGTIGTGTMKMKRMSVGGDGERLFNNVSSWIAQQIRIIETAPWGDDTVAINNQIKKHNQFHDSIKRNDEVEQAKFQLTAAGDKYRLNLLEQEWDQLMKTSFRRLNQLRDLESILDAISSEIMWVNEKEEQELVFDWGDKNIDVYVPKKEESYSRLMSDLEAKEKEINKLNVKANALLSDNHPASDKLLAYLETLQTQWSWLLKITKCIHVHLKENSAYSQFFKEANETYAKLQKQHETIRTKFSCDKSTPLENLTELLQNLEKEKQRVLENKRQVQSLVSKSKSIVRLKPRNPEVKSTSPVIVKALCDFMQDQKGILQGDEAILKDNSQRSKWLVTGPGGLEMTIPSVCLIIPPPNPISVGLANKNEQYYEAILGIWNQLYINIKSLISWQYCLKDMNYINSLTLTMLSKMNPEEYRTLIKRLETHYQEFVRTSQGSEMFGEEEKKNIQGQFDKTQQHYDTLIIQLPIFIKEGEEQMKTNEQWKIEEQTKIEQVRIEQARIEQARIEQAKMEEQVKIEQAKMAQQTKTEVPVKTAPPKTEVKVTQATVTKGKPPTQASSSVSLTLLSSLQDLHRQLEIAESGLTSHLHVPFGDNSVHECSVHIQKLQGVHQDLELIHDEYIRLREMIIKQLKGVPADSDQAKFLRSELEIINQKLGGLQGLYSAYIQRLSALKALLQSLLQAEDIVKVHEARLTEKDTSSLDPIELENYRSSLKHMKNELELKRELLTTMESELSKASHFNSQISDSFHKCDVDLAKYSEQVNLLGDRWRRIQTQIDNRMWDLDKQKDRVTQYQQSKTSLEFWIDNARKRQDTLQTVKINDVQMLMDHINQQKTLYNEIKGKKDKVDEMQKNADNCAASINDYELQLASYSSGLETLLNVPIKKTVLQSPAKVVRQEASGLQAHYIELLTRSSDYYKFLGDLLKNMEELKLRNTRIEMLEEELKRLKDDLLDKNQKNKSLEDALEQYKLELSQSKDELINLEEVKRTTSIQVSAVKESLGSTQGQIQDLNEQLSRVKYQLEEEKRKRRLAEERYNSQQEEYESAVRRRQKEYEEITWVKIDLEKAVKDKEREIERLKLQLEEEATRRRNAESDISKVRTQCTQEISQLKQTYETEIHVTKTTILKASQQKEEDATELRLLVQRLTDEKRDQEEELRRLRQSITLMEVQKTQAEQEVGQQRASVTQETRIRSELELQLRTLKHQREEDEVSLKEAMKSNQDKSRQISLLSFNLEEEGKKRRALELEINHLKQAEAELKSKNVSYLEAINKLKVTEQEIHITRVELEKQTSDKTKAEQSSARLQSHIRELQCSLDGMEAELEKQKNAAQEEFTRRKRMEAELERMTRTCREHTTTITSLKSVQIEASTSGRKYEQDIRALQEALDKSMRDHKATKEDLGAVADELKTLKQKLQQEQVRSHELNQRNETLYKTIEDKSRLLNDYTTEIGKLKTLTQNLTKDRLKLEEELRAARQERDELKSSKDAVDGEKATQISALNVQLQSSSKRTTELQVLISELTKEREMLKTEIEKFQKQTIETSMRVHESQSQYTELQLERDSLLSKLKLMEQDKNRLQRLEEELARTKLSLETEIRSKQRLQDEKNAMFKEFTTIKTQFEVKETQIRHCESDRDKADRERMSLKSEIERLMRELRTVEERYKSRLLSSEKEASELALKRDALEREIQLLKQRPSSLTRQTQTDENVPTIDPSKLLFDGVRRKVTAHQLCDCGIISKATLDDLLKGKKTVDEVAVDIQLSLKGTGIIAGMTTGAQGKMPFTEAKNKNLLNPESALMLLEAQAATGYIVDPGFNERMPVDTACSRGIVNTEDRDVLLKAEAASMGFKDPFTGKILSVGQAHKHGHIDKETTIRLLQAQESVGGILDPLLGVFLPKDLALDRNLIDEDLYRALNKKPTCYLDPATGEKITYSDLKRKCAVEPVSGLLLLRGPEKSMTVKGIRGEVSVSELVKAELLDKTDLQKLNEGHLSCREIEDKLKSYLYGSTCIAGIYDEANDRIMSFYYAMKEGLLMRGTTLELLEAQAASGFIVDPVNNVFLTVEDAAKRGLIGKEFKNKLLSAEKAVTGYKDPSTGKTISLFQAIEKDLIEKGHGIRLLEAQIASGGIIDPLESHRIDVSVAYKRGYFDKEMNEILTYEGDDTKGFFDPNTKENLTYLQLKERCITDSKTGLILLPIKDKNKEKASQESRTNILRKRRVVIVDPDTGLEMSVREAYHKQLIDYETFLDLSEQECEWEEINIKGPDGSSRLVIVDRKTGTQYDIQSCLNKGVIDQNAFDQYRSGKLTLTELADKITSKTSSSEMTIAASNVDDMVTCSSPTQVAPSSPTVRKRFSSISITVSPPGMFDDQSPVAAIFDTETLEKITIPEGHRRGIVDTITAQRLLEAQACTGGIINPATGERLSLEDAVHQSIIDESMAAKLKPAQKAYLGFEDLKTKRRLSAAEAVKETWLPYDAGQRFLEFQYLTGGLVEPGNGRRITMEEAIRKGWIDGQGAQKLQDTRNHQKNLTCPKTKLKISYKEAMDSCMVEEKNGMKMIQASSISSKGISSPYNVSNPGSRSGSRAGSRSGSRRGSVDYSSTFTYSFTSTNFSSNSLC
ncbi:desmoplakin-A isoform X1 [Nothobranchius furzeri]|uniref:Desmoplakin n=5 Tax=Nothobranchius TaxID=28779 RepID=A0A8C6L0B1_NOTFU|nr:transcript variant X1 [Nothobranchius furzeri]